MAENDRDEVKTVFSGREVVTPKRLERNVRFLAEKVSQIETILTAEQQRQGVDARTSLSVGRMEDTVLTELEGFNQSLVKAWRVWNTPEAKALAANKSGITEITHDLTGYIENWIVSVGFLGLSKKDRSRLHITADDQAMWLSLYSGFVNPVMPRVMKIGFQALEAEILGKTQKTTFNLGELLLDAIELNKIRDAAEQALPNRNQRQAALTIQANISEKVMFTGSQAGIFRAVNNIINNGIKALDPQRFSDQQGELKVKLTDEEDGVRVEIVDNGPGINCKSVVKSAVTEGQVTAEEAASLSPEKQIDLIFMEKVSGYKIEERLGNGVGLFVTRREIEKNGGKVTAENMFDENGQVKGARFVIKFRKRRE